LSEHKTLNRYGSHNLILHKSPISSKDSRKIKVHNKANATHILTEPFFITIGLNEDKLRSS
jgi:hypothetical protein